jgi:hypothetical protein
MQYIQDSDRLHCLYWGCVVIYMILIVMYYRCTDEESSVSSSIHVYMDRNGHKLTIIHMHVIYSEFTTIS